MIFFLHPGTWTVFLFDFLGWYDNEPRRSSERKDQACFQRFVHVTLHICVEVIAVAFDQHVANVTYI